MKVFLDTGAWIAIADSSDQYSKEASEIYTSLVYRREQLVTSDLVLIETYNLLLKTIGSSATIIFAGTLKNIPFLRVEQTTSPDYVRAWKIIEKYSDKDFSFTDCTSFALMERLKIRTAFSFDSHFRQFGFSLIQM